MIILSIKDIDGLQPLLVVLFAFAVPEFTEIWEFIFLSSVQFLWIVGMMSILRICRSGVTRSVMRIGRPDFLRIILVPMSTVPWLS